MQIEHVSVFKWSRFPVNTNQQHVMKNVKQNNNLVIISLIKMTYDWDFHWGFLCQAGTAMQGANQSNFFGMLINLHCCNEIN